MSPKAELNSPMITRRGALTGLLASAALPSVVNGEGIEAAEDTSNTADAFRISSPKDCYVLSVAVHSGDAVSSGQLICSLDSDEEDRALEKIDSATGLINLELANLDPFALVKQRRPLEIACTIAQSYLDLAYGKAELVRMNAEAAERGASLTGVSPINGVLEQYMRFQLDGGVIQARTAVTKAQAEVEKASLALERFDINAERSRKRYQILLDTLPLERKRIEADKSRLAVKSGLAGTIHLKVSTGSFVKKGAILAVIS